MGKLKSMIKEIYFKLNPVAKAAADQERARLSLIKGFGDEAGERLWEKAKDLSAKSDLSVVEAAHQVASWGYQMKDAADAVQEAWSKVTLTLQSVWDNIKTALGIHYPGARTEREKRIIKASYRKQRSQARNWKRWKKKRK